MFWSGNYIVVRELNFLLKEENVTLSQVLEAEDILQECKADNKNLMQFLTRPDILAELITLITEEPPQNVELTAQYRLASIACEVLTSDLSTLSDKLSMDVTQMHRLCDFITKPPPLNPLLASYFSKTVEMLLERSTKQDWYLYHIVCLRVLDFFKSRRDFLPNLLRHMGTSAIADTFKYFIRLDDLFNKIVMEWFDEHQLLESLVQVVCGGYLPDADEKGQRDVSEKRPNHAHHTANDTDLKSESEPPRMSLCSRLQAVASANAASLLCDIIVCGETRTRTQETLVNRLQSEECVRLLLQSMFTSRPHARAFAVVSGGRVLLALLSQDPILPSTGEAEAEAERSSVELAVAPHLPLLHQALLQDPRGAQPGVGLPRLQLAALAAQLARAEGEEVCNALRTLGTPGVLIDMMFSFPDNNFLHGAVYTFIKHALQNRVYRMQYAEHLFVECDLLTRLMDVYEENENKKADETRAAYMGHVSLALERAARALQDAALRARLPAPLAARWAAFAPALLLRVQQCAQPLGGYFPPENIYEVDNMADNLSAEYEFHDMSAAGALDELGDDLAADGLNEIQRTVSLFFERADRAAQRYDDDAWDDTPGAEDAGADANHAGESNNTWLPWEAEAEAGRGAEAGWARFDLAAPPPPADPFAPRAELPAEAPATNSALDEEFSAFWPPQPTPTADVQPTGSNTPPPAGQLSLEQRVQRLQLPAGSAALAGRLLSALSALPPHQRAQLVGARGAGAGADGEAHLGSNIGTNVGSNIEANVGSNIEANVDVKLEPNVGSNIGANVGSNIGANVEVNIGPNVESNIGANDKANVDTNVGDKAEANIEEKAANVGSNIGEQIDANVETINNKTVLTPVVAEDCCESNVGANSNCDSNVGAGSNTDHVGSSSGDVGSPSVATDTSSADCGADTSSSADSGTSADSGSGADSGSRDS